ncbi:MAG: methyltransferase domain-containing protein [Cyanobacteria bacterium J06581_3]
MQKELLTDWYIPDNHSRQITADVLVKDLLNQHQVSVVMDLGCGSGRSVELFQSIDRNIRWVGIDIDSSPEVNQRERTDAEFVSFDGVTIPFGDCYFDLIYCNQVLEHVRYPEALLKEVKRVLKPGGYFVGSTSQLEPYHSYSFWNYTPHGFVSLVKEAELQTIEIRPSIDSLTLIIRRGMGRARLFSQWWEKESPLNKVIGLIGKLSRKSHKQINLTKLVFAGQFCFIVRNEKGKREFA